MGRYYDGDIEGKFWFGVQSSQDAEFFGVRQVREVDGYIDYECVELRAVEHGIKECKEELGAYKAKIDKFFEKNNGYNDEMLAKAIDLPVSEVINILRWYARLHLGEKIKTSMIKNNRCEFSAEL